MDKLIEIKEMYSKCQLCPDLCKSRSQIVFGNGNENAEILFIGEAPGANEDKKGLPFCGMSGKILEELLQSIGLTREDIFITNTILCRPENNRNPAKKEVENCRERLDLVITTMQPKVIVTIGNFATERILGKTGIKSLKGKIFDLNGIKVVPVIHPANYLYSGRNPELWKEMVDDFRKIAEVIEVEKKQRRLVEF